MALLRRPVALLLLALPALGWVPLGLGRPAGPPVKEELPPALELRLRASLEASVARQQATLEQDLELRQDHSTWQTRWRVRTEHFEVQTVQSYAFGRFVADSMESLLPRMEEVCGLQVSASSPMVIQVFPDLTGYNTLGEEFAEHSSFLGSFYTDGSAEEVVATYYQDNPTLMRMWVTHSVLHQVLDRSAPGVTVQPWLGEGLASYFSLFWAYDYGVDQFEAMCATGRLIPLRDLLSADLTGYLDRPHERLTQLGMLFTYLAVIREDTRTQTDEAGQVLASPFLDYLRLRLRGQPAPNHPVRRLLFGQEGSLEADFHGFQGWR